MSAIQYYYSIPISQDEFEVLKAIKELDKEFFTVDLILIEEFGKKKIKGILNTLEEKGIIKFGIDQYYTTNQSNSEPVYFRFRNDNPFVEERFMSPN